MKKRLLLINPSSKFSGTSPPLGLLYIASSVKKEIAGFKIKLVDFSLDALNIENEIKMFKPDFVGISACSCEISFSKKIAKKIKQIDSKVIIIIGGPHVSATKSEILNDINFDFAVVGEGELSFSKLLKCLLNKEDIGKVKGIIYRNSKKIVENEPQELIEDLDKMPFPAWDIIDISKYNNFHNFNGMLKKKLYMPILTSRGCPCNCSFCYRVLGQRFRARSPENVLKEIKELHEKYGVNEFHIIDQIFNFDLKRSKKICDLIIQYNQHLAFSFPSGLKADIMDAELVDKLKAAGTYKINYSPESASSRVRDILNKKINFEKTNEIINLTSEKGIITFGYFMIGNPTETKKEIMETIDYAANSRLDLARFFFCTPEPGTELYKKYKEEFYDNCFMTVPHTCNKLTGKEMEELYKTALLRFYTRPRRILRLLCIYKFGIFKKIFDMYQIIVNEERFI